MADYLIVALLSGGFAIPVGFLLDLPAVETCLAAVAVGLWRRQISNGRLPDPFALPTSEQGDSL